MDWSLSANLRLVTCSVRDKRDASHRTVDQARAIGERARVRAVRVAGRCCRRVIRRGAVRTPGEPALVALDAG